MYKAVFIDIDGTLIKSNHTISEATFTAVQKLKEKNILIILVSARPLSGITPIAEKIGLLNYPVASLNGACIAADKKIIFNSTIAIDTITRVYETLCTYDATTIYYEQVQWFSEFQNAATAYEQRITSVPVTIQPFTETLQYWLHKRTGPNKIHVIATAAVVNKIQNNLKQLFINDLNIATSKPTYLEVMSIAASKSNAVKLLIEYHNIKRGEIIAIGDNFNDKEMIEFAGTGIAMGNAPAEVKAVADYVTDTNNNDGVAKALERFIGL